MINWQVGNSLIGLLLFVYFLFNVKNNLKSLLMKKNKMGNQSRFFYEPGATSTSSGIQTKELT